VDDKCVGMPNRVFGSYRQHHVALAHSSHSIIPASPHIRSREEHSNYGTEAMADHAVH
jgi:hypothetical protein